MIGIKGRGTQSTRVFTFELKFRDGTAILRGIHDSGRPTATAIFQKVAFITFITSTHKIAPAAEAVSLGGHRSRGGRTVTLRIRKPDAECVQIALLDASGVTVNSTVVGVTAWEDWHDKIRRPPVQAYPSAQANSQREASSGRPPLRFLRDNICRTNA